MIINNNYEYEITNSFYLICKILIRIENFSSQYNCIQNINNDILRLNKIIDHNMPLITSDKNLINYNLNFLKYFFIKYKEILFRNIIKEKISLSIFENRYIKYKDLDIDISVLRIKYYIDVINYFNITFASMPNIKNSKELFQNANFKINNIRSYRDIIKFYVFYIHIWTNIIFDENKETLCDELFIDMFSCLFFINQQFINFIVGDIDLNSIKENITKINNVVLDNI